MDSHLLRLLYQCSEKKPEGRSVEDTHTHVTLFGPASKWTISKRMLTEFWAGYCEIVRSYPDSLLSLAERVGDGLSLSITMTLRFDLSPDDGSDYYDENFIQSIAINIMQAINTMYGIEDDSHICIVLTNEGQEWIEDGSIHCMEIRFCFPCYAIETRRYPRLRQLILTRLRSSNVLGYLPCAPIGDLGSMITSNFQDPILMYGSTNNPNKPKLRYYGSYERNSESEDTLDPIDLVKVGGIVGHRDYDLIDKGLLTKFQDDGPEFWLPMILSVNYFKTAYIVREEFEGASQSSPSLNSPSSSDYDEETKGRIGVIDSLLPIISPARWREKHYWLNIGRALFTVFGGRAEGLARWISFSARHNAFPAERCKEEYSLMADVRHITEKTIAWYAKEDNLSGYEAWHSNWIQDELWKSLIDRTHTKIARVVYRTYWLEFAVASMKSSKWYWYRENTWTRSDGDVELARLISENFVYRLERYRTEISMAAEQDTSHEGRKRYNDRIMDIQKLIKSIQTRSYKSNILNELKEMFYNRSFVSLADKIGFCVGFRNCVIDICGKEAICRPGKPEDYVTKCTGINYNPSLTFNSPIVEEFMLWMSQLHTNPDVREYFLKYLASFLKRGNPNKLFSCWTGSRGDNGKSTIVKCIQNCLGEYCVIFPMSVLGDSSRAGAASPELAQADGALVAFLAEPDEEETMRGGAIKRYTGGDKIYVRGLYEEGRSIDTSFKVVLVCNAVPPIFTGGQAMKNRLRIIPYTSKWSYDAPETLEAQTRIKLFKRDDTFEERFPLLAQAMAWVMVQYYPKYANDSGLKEPEEISSMTSKFWKDTDIYGLFKQDCLVPHYLPDRTTLDESIVLGVQDMYQAFGIWYKLNFPSDRQRCPSSLVVRKEISYRIASPDEGYTFPGYTAKVSTEGKGRHITNQPHTQENNYP